MPLPTVPKVSTRRTRSAADFYAAGGGITGFQNGLAIAEVPYRDITKPVLAYVSRLRKQSPRDVVTMNSQVAIPDLDGGRLSIYTLVFPGSGDISKGKVSVLAPVGTALLGSRAGALIDLKGPGGRRRLRVEKILHQPEAARKSDAAVHVDRDSYYPAA